MFRSTLLCGALLAFVASAAADAHTATVHLRVVNENGENLDEATVSLFKDEDPNAPPPRDFASRFHHNAASRVPFGVYHLRVHATGFYTADRDVEVGQPEVWAVVSLKLGSIDGSGTYQLSGRLVGLDGGKGQAWVRLVGTSYGVMADAPVGKSGEFRVTVAQRGNYVLITERGNRVLDIRQIALPVAGPVEIALPSPQ